MENTGSFYNRLTLQALALVEGESDLIANLSNNDSYKDPDVFRKNLKSLADFSVRHRVKTLFVREANSPETNKAPSRIISAGMRNRGPRPSSRLFASRSKSSGRILASWR